MRASKAWAACLIGLWLCSAVVAAETDAFEEERGARPSDNKGYGEYKTAAANYRSGGSSQEAPQADRDAVAVEGEGSSITGKLASWLTRPRVADYKKGDEGYKASQESEQPRADDSVQTASIASTQEAVPTDPAASAGEGAASSTRKPSDASHEPSHDPQQRRSVEPQPKANIRDTAPTDAAAADGPKASDATPKPAKASSDKLNAVPGDYKRSADDTRKPTAEDHKPSSDANHRAAKPSADQKPSSDANHRAAKPSAVAMDGDARTSHKTSAHSAASTVKTAAFARPMSRPTPKRRKAVHTAAARRAQDEGEEDSSEDSSEDAGQAEGAEGAQPVANTPQPTAKARGVSAKGAADENSYETDTPGYDTGSDTPAPNSYKPGYDTDTPGYNTGAYVPPPKPGYDSYTPGYDKGSYAPAQKPDYDSYTPGYDTGSYAPAHNSYKSGHNSYDSYGSYQPAYNNYQPGYGGSYQPHGGYQPPGSYQQPGYGSYQPKHSRKSRKASKNSKSSFTTIGGMATAFGRPDWQLGFNGAPGNTSSCIEQVERVAARYGTYGPRNSIKLTPYFYYNWQLPEGAPADSQNLRHIVTKWLVANASSVPVDPTAEDTADYITGFAACISRAIDLGFEHIYVNPMIDPNPYQEGKCCAWRNAAEFDPTAALSADGTPPVDSDYSYGPSGFSYQTVILQPTLAAIQAAVTNNKKPCYISYGLGSEQGRSWTLYAAQWEALAREVVSTLRGVVHKLWVGPNFDALKLCGYYCDSYTDLTADHWAAFKHFLYTVNEFGVSSYPNVWDQYDPVSRTLDVSQSARKLDEQLKTFANVSIAELRGAKKRFIFGEFGLGGCEDFGCNGRSTPDIYELSKNAYNGAGEFINYYTQVETNPFYYAWTKAFRMEWYRQHLVFFKRKIPEIAQYAPDAAYIWGVGSWDVGAIYPPSTCDFDPDGFGCDPHNSFCDPDVLDLIKTFNIKGKYPGKLFWLPGVNTFKPPYRLARSPAPRLITLPFSPKDLPGWALPGTMTRPVWGSE